MSYPVVESGVLNPGASLEITFTPTIAGAVKLIAFASCELAAPPPPQPHSGDAPVKPEPPEPETLAVRLQVFKRGATNPSLDLPESQTVHGSGRRELLAWRDLDATASDLNGEWRARLTNTGTEIATCRLTARFPTVTGNLGKIDHVVVLMMENRSFDHMLGYLSLQGGRADVDGLTGHESNPDTDGQLQTVYAATSTTFKDDPNHGWPDVKAQLDGNNGFVVNFARVAKNEPHRAVMSYQTPATVPTYDRLAASFTICDRWFAALPTDTWPNRLYAMTGGSGGSITTPSSASIPSHPPGYTLQTIFEVLQAHGVDWNVFYSDVSFTLIFKRIVQDAQYTSRIRTMEQFFQRAHTGDLPSVSWLEPNYNDLQGDHYPSDDHPPGDVTNGQRLVAQIYNALAASPAWSKTLFVITYDEHGGFYDHVTPPGTDPPTTINKAAPPGTTSPPPAPIGGTPPADDDPALRRYGVRVPAIIVSPWVAARAVSKTTYDHTSILKTILERYCVEPLVTQTRMAALGGVATGLPVTLPNMGARVAAANGLAPLLANAAARTDAPASVPVPEPVSVPFDYTQSAATFALALRKTVLGL